MRVGVVSDTHSKELPARMMHDFKGVDLIVHAGDICGPEDFEAFARINKVEAVRGNMDCGDLSRKLPRRKIFTCDGLRVGLFHGEGPGKLILERVKKEFFGDQVDVVIFGHSHQAFNEVIDGVLYFNPGSATDLIFAPYRSYGILEFAHGQVNGKIIKVED